MSVCCICLGDLANEEAVHAICCRELFGTDRLPVVHLDAAGITDAGWQLADRNSISGVQPKLTMHLADDGSTLDVAGGGEFILKPPSPTYPDLPENEHTTMCIAKLLGLRVPRFGLLRLADGTAAYIVRRFDRVDHPPGKLRLEDFCQLAGLASDEKYNGSAELCARLVRAHSSQPTADLRELFQRMAFFYWTGNGDMHLKNFSLLLGEDGEARLSPAYDCLSTRLILPGDALALPVAGRKDRLSFRTWMDYAAYCGVAIEDAANLLASLLARQQSIEAFIARSSLPVPSQAMYIQILHDRSRSLRATRP